MTNELDDYEQRKAIASKLIAEQHDFDFYSDESHSYAKCQHCGIFIEDFPITDKSMNQKMIEHFEMYHDTRKRIWRK